MIVAGPRNLITDVPGLLVGQAEDRTILTGVTIVVPEQSMVMAVDSRGGAPGTRETEALAPENLVEEVHALVLSGGSVFGLDAASSVTIELARRGKGFKFGAQAWPCPVVPAAILFDLMNGGAKDWGDEPPYRRLGREALAAAAEDFAIGNAGAGYGAIAGAIKGGLGSASSQWHGFTVGALVAVNSAGSCVNPATGRLWAQDHALGTIEMGPGHIRPAEIFARTKYDAMAEAAAPGANTTIAMVATDARITKPEAQRLAIMANSGLSIAIRPLNTPFDGDTVFAAATGRRELGPDRAVILARLGALAATTLARAVGRGIWAAGPAGRAATYRSIIGA